MNARLEGAARDLKRMTKANEDIADELRTMNKILAALNTNLVLLAQIQAQANGIEEKETPDAEG